VEGPCGQWPDDIAEYNGTLSGWTNRNQPWENFGCATQNMYAKQVADPLDLVRGRPEGPASGLRRTTVINKYGQGQSTATIYPDEGKEKIVQGVGQ
jgi:pilus assembly protein CpaD